MRVKTSTALFLVVVVAGGEGMRTIYDLCRSLGKEDWPTSMLLLPSKISPPPLKPIKKLFFPRTESRKMVHEGETGEKKRIQPRGSRKNREINGR